MAQRCPPTSRWSRTSSLSCPVEVMMPFTRYVLWPWLWMVTTILKWELIRMPDHKSFLKKPCCMEKCSWYLASKACSRFWRHYSPFRIKVKWAFPGHGVTDRAVACSANDPSLILLSSKLLSPLGHKVVRFKKEPKVIGDRFKPT